MQVLMTNQNIDTNYSFLYIFPPPLLHYAHPSYQQQQIKPFTHFLSSFLSPRAPPQHTMVSQDAFRTAVGVIGNIIALFLFLSPMPTFIRIYQKKSVEQYSAVPYLATLINCLVWILYGLPMVHPHSFLVITINGAGTAIEVVYILMFLIYSDRKVRARVLLVVLAELVFFAVLSFLVLRLAHTWEKRSTIVGIICILFNVMMYASPLAVMKLVITTKSVEFMPFSLSMASFANGIAWSAYALIRFDKFIFIPNGLGSIFSLAQLALYATYYKNTKRMIAARQAKGEIGMEEVVVSSSDLKKPSAAPNGHA